MATESESPVPSAPVLRIINADATPEEVAAIVAVLSSLGGGEAPKRRPRPEWNTPARMLRPALAPGPGAWRAGSLPR